MEHNERKIAIVTVVVPLIGFIAAIAIQLRHPAGRLDMAMLGVMYACTVIGIGVGYHRLLTHRAFTTHKIVRMILATLGSMAGQGPVLFWVALHRQHHKFSDRPGDPHSPHISGEEPSGWLSGLWHAHVGWMLNPQQRNLRFVIDLMKEPEMVLVNKCYFHFLLIGIAIPAVIHGVVSHSWGGVLSGLLWGGLVRIFLVHHVTWSINSICHLYGSRPFANRDHSTNNLWLSLLSFGEAWHNNHHAFPQSARHGLQWWQVDINSYFIRCLETVGLAWDVKAPSQERLAAKAGS